MLFFKADFIFPVTSQPVPNGILVTKNDGTILSIHKTEKDIFKTYPKLQRRNFKLETYSGILCPGFVNAHCHLELSFLNNKIKQGGGIVHFIQQLLKKRASYSDALIKKHIRKADEEMYANGIAAVGDISNSHNSFYQKLKSKIYYHTFIEALDLKPTNTNNAFFLAQGLVAALRKTAPKNCAVSIVPHAPYTVTTGLFELIKKYPYNKVVSIHNQESKAENEFFKNKKGTLHDFFVSIGNDLRHVKSTGQNSVCYSLPYLKNIKSVLLVHNTFTSKDDLTYILNQKPDINFCLCPSANLYIEKVLPQINMLAKSGANICIGTDSYASNKNLSVLEEIKTISKNFKSIPLTQLIYWATKGGADALDIADKFGAFKTGIKPGIIHISNIKSGRLTLKSVVRRIK
ncbi:MAG TPA: amidohydrolase family protein [Bacteroidia bacterium]|nr:amidohydrolase family protein [Bacteroidia bacterium]HNU32528.1 amidohydrolase family protein [Bacteroidia bacterium]